MITIAWVKNEDIKAVRSDDGCERLLVDGVEIHLTADYHHSPVQQVINYARSGKRARAALRRSWAELGAKP